MDSETHRMLDNIHCRIDKLVDRIMRLEGQDPPKEETPIEHPRAHLAHLKKITWDMRPLQVIEVLELLLEEHAATRLLLSSLLRSGDYRDTVLAAVTAFDRVEGYTK